MAFSVVITALVVIAIILKILLKPRSVKLVDCLPGPAPYPLVGNIPQLLVPREKMFQGMISRQLHYGPIYRLWMGNIPVVHVCAPEYAELLLSSTKHTTKGNIYRFLQPWLGTGLLTAAGRKWYQHRKLITPTFHFKILENFVDIFNENADILIKNLKTMASRGEKYFDLYPYITRCALDIICETAMGTKINAQKEQKAPYVESIYRISELTIDRSNKIWHHPNVIYFNSPKGKDYKRNLKIVHDFTEKVIRERKELRQHEKQSKNTEESGSGLNEIDNRKRKAFLDLLLEAVEQNGDYSLTENDIKEEVDTFMFAGHDTTTAAVSWTLHTLGHHPEIQEQLQQEFSSIFGENRTSVASVPDLGKMKLLERVIKETLRLYPIVPFISRRLDADIQLGTYTIPAKTTVALNIFSMHRNPAEFPEPDKFNPDRFQPENISKRHKFAYIPFSAGPRNCIGQKFALLEEKVLLSTILRNFKVEALDDSSDLTLIMEIILRPLQGVRLKLTPRT